MKRRKRKLDDGGYRYCMHKCALLIWPRNWRIETDHAFFFLSCIFLSVPFSPLQEQEHHSLFCRSEREQLSVEGAGSRWQVMNGRAGCKWQYADKPDHLQMDVGRWRMGGVEWGGGWFRGKSGAEEGVGVGSWRREGVNPSRIISQQRKVVEEAQPPAQQRSSFVRSDGGLRTTGCHGEYTAGSISTSLCWPTATKPAQLDGNWLAFVRELKIFVSYYFYWAA